MDETDDRWIHDLDRPPAVSPKVRGRTGATPEQTVQALGAAFVVLSALLVLVAPFVGDLAGPLMASSLVAAVGCVALRTAEELRPVAHVGLLGLLVVLLPFF